MSKSDKKKFKWAKGLPRELINCVIDLGFKDVVIESHHKEKYTIARITFEDNDAIGIAICSTTEPFDPLKGKKKALGRAVGAAKRGFSADIIRSSIHSFPKNWSILQAENVYEKGKTFIYKSLWASRTS